MLLLTCVNSCAASFVHALPATWGRVLSLLCTGTLLPVQEAECFSGWMSVLDYLCMPCLYALPAVIAVSHCGACTGTLPPVQRAVLTLLPNLAPTELPQLWPDLIQLHLNLLQPQHLPSQASLSAESSEGHAHANVNRHALTALSMEKTAEMLAALYR